MSPAAGISATGVAASRVAATGYWIPAALTIAAFALAAAEAIAAVEPWAGSNEDAAYEVIRAIEAVRSAGIGGVIVVTVLADWRTCIPASVVAWADADANRNLCVREGYGKKEDTE